MPAALFLPLLVCTRSVAACKAAQAVRGSSVKLEGRDVLSTWKIMVSLVAYPTLYIVYTAAAFSLGGRYLPEPWPLEAGLLFFFFFPVVSYGAVKGGENVVRVARSLVPLGTVVLRPSYGHVLVEQRAALTAAMLGLVDEQGWVMPETPPLTPPRTPPAASADADRLVEPPSLYALALSKTLAEPLVLSADRLSPAALVAWACGAAAALLLLRLLSCLRARSQGPNFSVRISESTEGPAAVDVRSEAVVDDGWRHGSWVDLGAYRWRRNALAKGRDVFASVLQRPTVTSALFVYNPQ